MGYDGGMNPEKLKIVHPFVRGNAVFGVLLTGYGKSPEKHFQHIIPAFEGTPSP